MRHMKYTPECHQIDSDKGEGQKCPLPLPEIQSEGKIREREEKDQVGEERSKNESVYLVKKSMSELAYCTWSAGPCLPCLISVMLLFCIH